MHGDLARAFRRCDLVWVWRRDAVEASGGETEHLHRHAHRVCGELSAACTRPWAGGVLKCPELFGADLPRTVGANRLKDALHGDVLPVEGAGEDRAVIEDQSRDVEATERHRGARARLVATGEADDAVKAVPSGDELNGVGDQVA